MILTNAGKPVFSLYGDISNLSTIFATLYAIVSKAQTYQFKDCTKPKEKVIEMENPYLPPQAKKETIQEVQNDDRDDESTNAQMKAIISHTDNYKFIFLTKASLIYIVLSRQRDESVSFLKKQLEMLHL